MNFRFLRTITIYEWILALIVVAFSIKPVQNYDVWFHLKYGQYIVETGSLPFADIFSHSALGLPAVPYEWLFQILLFVIYDYLGTLGVQALVALLALTFIAVFRAILIRIFDLGRVPRLLILTATYCIGYDYWIERPQSMGYVLFMLMLYLVLSYIVKGGRLIFLAVPLMYIWVNTHASMILGVYLLIAFSCVSIASWIHTKKRDSVKRGVVLGIVAVAGAIVTLLPPLGNRVWGLLLLFYEKRALITTVIDEWSPLWEFPERFYLYVAILLGVSVSYLWAIIRVPQKRQLLLLMIPLLPLGLLVISGIRHTLFSFPAMFLLAAYPLHLLLSRLPNRSTAILQWGLLFAGTIFLFFYKGEATRIPRPYPTGAIPFIREHIQGNMFNSYELGGYLMYYLGPETKTFIDGRTDMFLPNVLEEYVGLHLRNDMSDETLAAYFGELDANYQFSWAIFPPRRLSTWSRLTQILSSDQSWHLVYVDDSVVIFVKESTGNEETISSFGMNAITPWAGTLYRKDMRDQAKIEYEKMHARLPSATTANALGYFYLEDREFGLAREMFIEALEIDKTAAAPKINLAELIANDGNYKEAVRLYRQAIGDDPTRSFAYLRLGQFIIAAGESREEARKIWEQGLRVTSDEQMRQQLMSELLK